MTPEQRLAQIPESMRKGYKKAISGQSRAAAIKAQCFECCGWNRSEAKRCPDTGCPLWRYRPGGER